VAAAANRLRVERDAALVEANFTLHPRRPNRGAALRRLRRDGWSGTGLRQWLFVARLLAQRGRPDLALRRVWRGYLQPLGEALGDPAATHWALEAPYAVLEGGVSLTCVPSRPDGNVPGWAEGVAVTRRYHLGAGELCVEEVLRFQGRAAVSPIARIEYLVPGSARAVQVEVDGRSAAGRPGGRVVVLPSRGSGTLRVAYTL
jgi:hypothetical protein